MLKLVSSAATFGASAYAHNLGFKFGPPVHDLLTVVYVADPKLFYTYEYAKTHTDSHHSPKTPQADDKLLTSHRWYTSALGQDKDANEASRSSPDAEDVTSQDCSQSQLIS